MRTEPRGIATCVNLRYFSPQLERDSVSRRAFSLRIKSLITSNDSQGGAFLPVRDLQTSGLIRLSADAILVRSTYMYIIQRMSFSPRTS